MEKFHAVDPKGIYFADLKGPVHPIFHKDRWKNIDAKRYDAMHQSFQIATRLLEVAGPYLCNFLPRPVFHPDTQNRYSKSRPNKRDKVDDYESDESWEPCEGFPRMPERVVIDDKRDPREIELAHRELLDMAKYVQWEETSTLLKEGGFGLNHTGKWKANQVTLQRPDDWIGASERDIKNNLPRRRIVVAVTTKFVDVLLKAPKTTDRHLTAAFACGINLVHELGHTIWVQNLKHDADPVWFGEDVYFEHGTTLIAWLFDGWYPDPIIMKNEMKDALHYGQSWWKQYRAPCDAPKSKITYSVRLEHVQNIMSQASWDQFSLPKDSLRVRKNLLSPRPPFKLGEHARRGLVISGTAWDLNPFYNFFSPSEKHNYDDEEAKFFGDVFRPMDEDWDDQLEVSAGRRVAPRSGSSGRQQLALSKMANHPNL